MTSTAVRVEGNQACIIVTEKSVDRTATTWSFSGKAMNSRLLVNSIHGGRDEERFNKPPALICPCDTLAPNRLWGFLVPPTLSDLRLMWRSNLDWTLQCLKND